MAPAYKLTYFNLGALGEPIRLLLAYGQLEFEDVRIEYKDWPKIKPTTPNGQLPILEVNGKIVYQSLAISRYLGRLLKLAGSNEWEDLEIDVMADTITEFRTKVAAYFYEDADLKVKRKAILDNETIPYYVKKLEEQVKKNKGYLAVGKLTWLDVYFVGILEYLVYMGDNDWLENAPGLKELVNKVNAVPNIKFYLEKRTPPTTMVAFFKALN